MPRQRLHVEYYDLPRAMRFWKSGQRGVYLYYLLWQWGAYRKARGLQRTHQIDLIHHVTFANYWLPTFMPRLGIPFLFGPVGGGEDMPEAFLSQMSAGGRAFEVRRGRVLRWAERVPAVRRQLRRGRVLATSESMAARARLLGATDVQVFGPPVGVSADERIDLASSYATRDPSTGTRFISIGRLLPWKGFHLGLRAFADMASRLPEATYDVIGDGPEKGHLLSIVRDAGLGDRVRFLGVVPRRQMLEVLACSDVLVHPSMHDPGAWVVAEALAAGLPVVCHEGGGPATLVGDAGVVIPYTDSRTSIESLSDAFVRLATDADYLGALSRATELRSEGLLWDNQGDRMQRQYHDVAGL
ncbi:MAG: glycosyltransferase [Coriobacteriia bacterium]|nr:glycosyltransferase [Coriobacteriia bacterium]